MQINLKYIDTTYMIRGIASNTEDTIMCAKLAFNAVHGAMAGYTGFSVGIIRNTAAWIPVNTLIEAGTNRISVNHRSWEELMELNG